jgi:alanine dehydrogenase
MTLILSNNDVEKLLTIEECMSTLEQSYTDLAEGRGLNRRRSDCLVPTGDGDQHYSLKSMDGVIPSLGVASVRINSDIVEMRQFGEDMRRVKVPAADGRYVGLVYLFSTLNGEPLAIFPDGVIQRFRVGATSGLGIKYLARKDASTVGLIGAGGQATTQLLAACAQRRITSVRCFSPSRERREHFARTMQQRLGIEVRAVDSAEAAVRDVDIALCATSSEGPVFFDTWLRPGQHVGAIRKPEIEDGALKAADRVVIHTRDTSPITEISVDLAGKDHMRTRKEDVPSSVDFKALPTLAEVIAGRAMARQADSEITCFVNNLGMGYQFAAAGAIVYRKAKEQGIGHALPTDWFTEDICP